VHVSFQTMGMAGLFLEARAQSLHRIVSHAKMLAQHTDQIKRVVALKPSSLPPRPLGDLSNSLSDEQ
jgi:hypothetical protein